MAAKDKKTVRSSTSQTKVTRITATDNKKSAKKTKTPPSTTKAAQPAVGKTPANKIVVPLAGIGRYFKGAWYELRQVRWPNRRATWSLTAAMLVFTGFFAVLILLLDALFKYVFQLILG